MAFKLESSKPSHEIDRDLVVLDVGCRWGFAEQFINSLDIFRLYGFEPDKEECQRLQQLYDTNRITMVPLGLADREGECTLHLTKEPACSSMYEPDSILTNNCSALDCARKVNEISMQLTTVDRWAKQSDIEYVDYIKIDTQGSELLILNGAESILKTVRTLQIEVEFNPIYLGQPLFADVDSFLRQRGFVLWKLTNLVHYGHQNECTIAMGEDHIYHDERRQTIKKYGGQLYWADAHYVRVEIAQAAFTTQEQLLRDITLLDSLNYFDLVDRLKNVLDLNSLNSF